MQFSERKAIAFLLGAFAAACSMASHDLDRSPQAIEDVVVAVTDQTILMSLEENGLSLSAQLAATEPAPNLPTSDLYRTSAMYRSLADRAFDAILDELGTLNDHRAGFGKRVAGSYRSAVGRRWSFRLPNPSWMASPDARFELVGITNRFDRRHLPESSEGCGEVRLNYRMAYDTRGSSAIPPERQEYSRLPMTVALVYPLRASSATGDCTAAAARWVSPAAASSSWLLTGPLADLGQPVAVLVNLQVAHWPQDAAKGQTGASLGSSGHHVFFAFDVAEQALTARSLENTPDLAIATASDRANRLMDWIAENLESIDQGAAVLPAEFLASPDSAGNARSFLVTGLGIERRNNRLFSRVLLPDGLTGAERDQRLGRLQNLVDLAGSRGLSYMDGSVEALLRRLDATTCVGCHQSRSVLGFHLPGEERETELLTNQVYLGLSTHLSDELERRRDDLLAALNGQNEPQTVPPPELGYRPPMRGVHGSPCALRDEGQNLVDPGLDHLGCNEDLVCVDAEPERSANAIGWCMTSNEDDAGNICEYYEHRPNENRYLDGATLAGHTGCSNCGPRSSDFPIGGACLPSCDLEQPGTSCHAVSSEEEWTRCLGRRTFDTCLREATPLRGLLRDCDTGNPCRDEFVCMAVMNDEGTGLLEDRGACAPPYLFGQFFWDPHIMTRADDPTILSLPAGL